MSQRIFERKHFTVDPAFLTTHPPTLLGGNTGCAHKSEREVEGTHRHSSVGSRKDTRKRNFWDPWIGLDWIGLDWIGLDLSRWVL